MIFPHFGKKSLNIYLAIFIPAVLLTVNLVGLNRISVEKTALDVLSGKFNPSKNETFQIIPTQYSTQASSYMHGRALEAFMAMAEDAKKDGFTIYINSAFRDFSSQKYIWESKFNGQRLVEGKNLKKEISDEKVRALKILEYSSMPGTSRHHWGTDIDIGYNKNINQMLTNTAYESGEGLQFYNWMQKHASDYGFCQPYKESPKKRNINIKYGYQEEKWHWSYKPLSSEYLKTYIENAKKFTPSGFAGSSAGAELYLDYVRNIHQDCK
jgi:LAS superfamily LD-carboxypeptidase LdcB